MSGFSPNYRYFIDPENGIHIEIEGSLKKFNPKLLNIGNLKAPSKPIEVLSVVFDLEGFTNFTSQIDPQLSIPNYISEFFHWLFRQIRTELKVPGKENIMWAELPFFSKFMGDGALFLWKIDLDKIKNSAEDISPADLKNRTNESVCNIVATMYEICKDYGKFYKLAETNYTSTPKKLRCGIARGNVFPIGNGLDFVGPCINIASRLQKFNGLSFTFSARGIAKSGFSPEYASEFRKKRVSIRGIGDGELIFVLKDEFNQLPDDLKSNFIDV